MLCTSNIYRPILPNPISLPIPDIPKSGELRSTTPLHRKRKRGRRPIPDKCESCRKAKKKIRVTAAQVIVAANNTIATWDRKTDFLPDLLSLHPTSQIDEIKINELDHIGTAEIDIKRPPITHDTPEDIATSRELTPVGSEFSYLMGFSPAPSIRSQPHLPEPEKLGLSRKDSGLRRSEPPRSVSPTPPPSPYHLSRDKLSSIIASLRDRDGFLQPIAVPLKPPLPFPMTSRSEIVQTGNS